MSTRRPSLVELRVLDGANLYFPRPAVKLTLDLSSVLDADDARVIAMATQLGVRDARPGAPGTGLRQRFAAKLVVLLLRRIAQESGTSRLAVRSRPVADPQLLVIAYPWHHRERAEALGHGLAGVLDALPEADVWEAVRAAAVFVLGAEAGEAPTTRRPHIPVVAVTGTNGKTTTSRMVARMGGEAGLSVGWVSADEASVDGRLLDDPRVQLAVTETARGDILPRGLGVAHNDVSVVTNVSADHRGPHGVDTVDQLAEVKAVVTRVTLPEGWVVLNGDDPRTFAMRLGTPARPVIFSRDPDSPSLGTALSEGGRAVTVIDGAVTVLAPRTGPDRLVPLVDVPVTLAGLSRSNVENALAATGAGLAVGLPREAVIAGLRSFRPDPHDNPGRMNVYDLHGVTVIVDQAHNEAGVEALLEAMDGLRAPQGATRLVLGCPADRTDDVIRRVGERGARRADQVVIGHKTKHLRGRDPDALTALLRGGAAAVGVTDVDVCPTELDAVRLLVSASSPGDAVGVMCHEQQRQIDAWLRASGGTVDGPDEIAAKVFAAHRS